MASRPVLFVLSPKELLESKTWRPPLETNSDLVTDNTVLARCRTAWTARKRVRQITSHTPRQKSVKTENGGDHTRAARNANSTICMLRQTAWHLGCVGSKATSWKEGGGGIIGKSFSTVRTVYKKGGLANPSRHITLYRARAPQKHYYYVSTASKHATSHVEVDPGEKGYDRHGRATGYLPVRKRGKSIHQGCREMRFPTTMVYILKPQVNTGDLVLIELNSCQLTLLPVAGSSMAFVDAGIGLKCPVLAASRPWSSSPNLDAATPAEATKVDIYVVLNPLQIAPTSIVCSSPAPERQTKACPDSRHMARQNLAFPETSPDNEHGRG